MNTTDTDRPRPAVAADILTIGFGTAVIMWAVGYFCRLFGDAVPAPLLFALLIASLLAGGSVAGRYTERGVRGGLYAGLVAGLLNLLIVGSLISGDTPNEIRTGALLWIPGTLIVCVVLGTLGAAIGRAAKPATAPSADWRGGLAVVATVATFLLLTAGGLVTGTDEGLAVTDWPNTEGYNMFFYPLARMTGGVYLEHAHRLLGSLVGLTTLVLAIYTQLVQRGRGIKLLAWIVLVLVIGQGVLGGLRVTGHLTLSTQPADTSPNILLAVIHGAVGQLVLACLVALAVVSSRRWHGDTRPTFAPGAGTDRFFGIVLLLALIIQLVLGTLVRHFTWALEIQHYGLVADPQHLRDLGERALTIHLTLAVLVALLAVAVGVRSWGLYRGLPTLPLLGRQLLILIGLQLVLGVGALIVTGNDAVHRRPGTLDVALTTAHQVVGAALLAWTVMLVLWNYRLLTAERPAA